MKLSSHLPKFFFALADKSLPLFYGLGIILIVIRTIPIKEYGILVLVQSTFYLIQNMNEFLVLRPMVKYLSADLRNGKWVIPHSFVLSVTFFCLTLGIVTVLSSSIGDLLHFPSFSSYLIYLWGLPLAFFLKSFAISILNSQVKPFKVFVIDFVYYMGSLVGILLMFLKNNLDTANDVLYVNIVAALSSSIVSLPFVLRYLSSIELKINRQRFKSIFQFGKYTFGAGIGSTIFQRGDNYVLSAILSPIEVATYNAGRTFMRFFNIISQSVNMLFFPIISRLKSQGREKDIKAVIEKGIGFYILLLYPVIVVLILVAKPLLSFIYGCKYPNAHIVFQILLVGMVFHPFLCISSACLLGLGKPRFNMVSKFISIPLNIIGNIVLIPIIGVYGSAVAVVLYMSTESIFLFFWLKKFTNCTIIGIFTRYRDVLSFGKELIKGAKDIKK